MSQYFQAVRQALGAIEMTQVPVIRQAAERFAATILTGRLVHVFGTGHSRMAVEEMFPRYGSFPGFHPIVELSMSYHNPVVGANGQRQAMFLENVQGFGPVLWRNFAVTRDDALLAISSSGCNAVTIDVAIEARLQGMFVVALTSQANAAASTSRHQSGRKLHEVADLVLDQQAPPGDSAVWIKDLQTPVAPNADHGFHRLLKYRRRSPVGAPGRGSGGQFYGCATAATYPDVRTNWRAPTKYLMVA